MQETHLTARFVYLTVGLPRIVHLYAHFCLWLFPGVKMEEASGRKGHVVFPSLITDCSNFHREVPPLSILNVTMPR